MFHLPKLKKEHIPLLAFLACLVIAFLFLFWPGIENSKMTVWSADHGMESHRYRVEGAKHFGGFEWRQTQFLGTGNKYGILLYPNWPILATFPLGVSFWLNVAFLMACGGIGAWYCARKMGVGRWGAAFSGIAFVLTSHMISLLYPGHISKMQAIPWIPWAMGFFWQGWQTGRFKYYILTAMALGVSLQSGEPQLALYLGFSLAAMAAYSTISLASEKHNSIWSNLGKRTVMSAACAILAVLLAYQSTSKFSSFLTKNTPTINKASEKTEQTQEEKAIEDQKAYDFATGWSFPPEDCLTFLLTGQLFGGKSPGYWGRMGTKNLKLKQTDDYLGILVVAFALLGLVLIKRQKAIMFLFLMLLGSLLLAFGRYTPIYRLIYSLPTMASQRVPARWVIFTATSAVILAGFGFEHFLEICRSDSFAKRKRYLALPAGMIALTAILWFVLLFTGTNSSDFAQSAFGTNGSITISVGSQLASLRATRFISAIKTAQVLLIIGALVLTTGLFVNSMTKTEQTRRTILQIVAFACLGLATIDLSRNAEHFIQFYDWQQFHKSNSLIDFFKKDPDLFRIQPIGAHRHPVLNQLLGPVGKWHRLRFTEAPEAHRTERKLDALFNALSSESRNYRFNPRYYDIFNVKYVLSSMKLPADLQKNARLSLISTIPFGNRTPPLFLYRYAGFTANPAFVSTSVAVRSETNMLSVVCSDTFDSNHTVAGENISSKVSNAKGTASLIEFGKRHIEISTVTDGTGWIICKERYTPDWKAFVDGEPAETVNLNYLHFGTQVPSGRHKVEFMFSPPHRTFNITVLAWIFTIAIFPAIYILRLKTRQNKGVK